MDLESWRVALPFVALGIPGVLALVALLAPRRAGLASVAALSLASAFAIGAALTRGAASFHFGVRVDAVTCVMLLLVSALGAVIVRYSRSYLEGDPGLDAYWRWLLLTLSAVTAVVVADDLLFIALGWTATSFALHRLLTFYPTRTAALVAAHKKFLVSRLADACLLACLALVHRDVGSLALDDLTSWVAARPDLTVGMECAAVLLVLAVVLRSAQLPFHGWLMQVMEAPTPVSALLHAGVVNIGGFVLIRLAPWISEAGPARLLLLTVGLGTTVIAALVMTTRVSVKVGLAWSTCAQMGFMLVQCGLGAWHLALLHLVAHSLYKAHAFLNAGSTVDDWRTRTCAPRRATASWRRLGITTLVTVGAAAVCLAALQVVLLGSSPASWGSFSALAVLLGLSTTPLALAGLGSPSKGAHAAKLVGVILLYGGWHLAAAAFAPVAPAPADPVAWALVGVGMAALFAIKTTLSMRPDGSLSRALYPWLFAGLYLDEAFTRLTFRLWPPHLRGAREVGPSPRFHTTVEAQA